MNKTVININLFENILQDNMIQMNFKDYMIFFYCEVGMNFNLLTRETSLLLNTL